MTSRKPRRLLSRATRIRHFFLTLAAFGFAASCGGGGGGTGGPGGPGGGGGGGGGDVEIDPLASTLEASVAFGTPADGAATVLLTATVVDVDGNPVEGLTVVLTSSGAGNTLLQPGATGADGTAVGSLASVAGETKTVSGTVIQGTNLYDLQPVQTTFVRIEEGAFFVRTSGSDANSGRSPVDAWRTIGHALSQVGAGDTVHVGAGTYPESAVITTVASAAEPLVLRGDRDGAFTGDAGEVLVDADGLPFGIRLDGASGVVLRDLSIRGTAGAGGGAVSITGAASDCAVVGCSLFENERGVQASSGARIRLENNRVSGNLASGVVLGSTADSFVLHNLIYGNAAAGINLSGVSTNLRIEYNTLFQNAGDQIRESVAGGTGALVGNVMADGGGDGLQLMSASGMAEGHNLAWGHAAQNFNLPGALPSPTSMIADPAFVDPFGADGILGGVGATDDDFRFQLASAAFDAGDAAASDRLLGFGAAFAAMTSRADQTPDGTAPDGLVANLGFHYPLMTDPYGSLDSFEARVALARPGDVFVETRSWSPTSGFAAPIRPLALNAEIDWLVHRASPRAQPDELVAVLADTGTRTLLYVREWNGRAWTEGADAPPIHSNIRSANSGERGFDVEYEQMSGEALLVHSNDDANPLFRTLRNGKWSVDAPVFSPSPGTGAVLWVELVPKVGSDEIALVALDDQENIFAAIWDGDAWGHPTLLGNQIVNLREWKAFDAAWESLSGRLLVVWGYSAYPEEAHLAVFDPSDGSWTFGQHDHSDAVGALVELVSDPSSDRIMAAFAEGPLDDDVTIDIWDGTAWPHNVEVAPQGLFGLRDVEIGWLGSSGRGYALYRTASLAGSFNVAIFDNFWHVNQQLEIQLPGVGRFVRAESMPVPGEDRAMIVLLDETGKLFAADVVYTPGVVPGNLTFTLLNGGAPLATGLDPAGASQHFSLDFRRY